MVCSVEWATFLTNSFHNSARSWRMVIHSFSKTSKEPTYVQSKLIHLHLFFKFALLYYRLSKYGPWISAIFNWNWNYWLYLLEKLWKWNSHQLTEPCCHQGTKICLKNGIHEILYFCYECEVTCTSVSLPSWKDLCNVFTTKWMVITLQVWGELFYSSPKVAYEHLILVLCSYF